MWPFKKNWVKPYTEGLVRWSPAGDIIGIGCGRDGKIQILDVTVPESVQGTIRTILVDTIYVGTHVHDFQFSPVR